MHANSSNSSSPEVSPALAIDPGLAAGVAVRLFVGIYGTAGLSRALLPEVTMPQTDMSNTDKTVVEVPIIADTQVVVNEKPVELSHDEVFVLNMLRLCRSAELRTTSLISPDMDRNKVIYSLRKLIMKFTVDDGDQSVALLMRTGASRSTMYQLSPLLQFIDRRSEQESMYIDDVPQPTTRFHLASKKTSSELAVQEGDTLMPSYVYQEPIEGYDRLGEDEESEDDKDDPRLVAFKAIMKDYRDHPAVAKRIARCRYEMQEEAGSAVGQRANKATTLRVGSSVEASTTHAIYWLTAAYEKTNTSNEIKAMLFKVHRAITLYDRIYHGQIKVSDDPTFGAQADSGTTLSKQKVEAIYVDAAYAAHYIILTRLRLVNSLVQKRKYQTSTPQEDLFNVGVEGLERAIAKIRPKKWDTYPGYFSTAIHHSIEQYIANTTYPIRVPLHLYKVSKMLIAIRRRLLNSSARADVQAITDAYNEEQSRRQKEKPNERFPQLTPEGVLELLQRSSPASIPLGVPTTPGNKPFEVPAFGNDYATKDDEMLIEGLIRGLRNQHTPAAKEQLVFLALTSGLDERYFAGIMIPLARGTHRQKPQEVSVSEILEIARHNYGNRRLTYQEMCELLGISDGTFRTIRSQAFASLKRLALRRR